MQRPRTPTQCPNNYNVSSMKKRMISSSSQIPCVAMNVDSVITLSTLKYLTSPHVSDGKNFGIIDALLKLKYLCGFCLKIET